MNYGSSTFKSTSSNNNQTNIGVIVDDLKFQTSTFGLKEGSRECEEDEVLLDEK